MKLVIRYENQRWHVATPSLDSNAAQGSVSALAFLKTNEPSGLGSAFSRHVEKFEIYTFVDQDDDTGSVSSKLVKKRNKLLSLSASRGNDDKCAA